MGPEDLQRSRRFQIDDLTLDVGRFRLTRGGEPLRLTKLNFLLLRCLVESAPNVVSHTDLARRVWGDRRVITHENLAKRVMLLRQALGDTAASPRYIEPVRGVGYRLLPEVVRPLYLPSPGSNVDTSTTTVFAPPIEEGNGAAPREAAPDDAPAGHEGEPVVVPSERRSRAVAWVSILALVLAAVAAVVRLSLPAANNPEANPVGNSLAVLPFADFSAAKDQEYLSFGIAEQLIDRLDDIPGLRVAGRTSSFSFAGRDLPRGEVARALGVTHVLDGSVRTDGAKLTISARLTDAESNTQVWAGDFEREVNDVLAVQDEIAARLASHLSVEMSPHARPDTTSNPDVYGAYLKARHINRTLVMASVPAARSLLERAVAQDPDYLPARTELVATYNILHGAGLLDSAEAERLLRSAIADAAARWPQRPEVHFLEAWFAFAFENDLRAAAEHFEIALPHATNLDMLAIAIAFASTIKRHDDAIEIGEYVLERDPICYFCYANLLRSYYLAERYDKVAELYWQARTLGFDQPELTLQYGQALLEIDDPAEALRQFESIEWPRRSEHVRLAKLSMAYWSLHRKADFETVFGELQKGSPYMAASVEAFTGNLDAAFATFVAEPSLPIDFLDGRLGDAMRVHPRWPELAEKVGIWPDDPRDSIRFELELPP